LDISLGLRVALPKCDPTCKALAESAPRHAKAGLHQHLFPIMA
jgi:hypothetical protein